MLDDDEALALVPKLEDKIEELVKQGPVDAGGRLIEEDDLGVEHENPDELKKPLLSVGEITGELVPEGVEVYEGQQLLSLVAVFSLTTFRSRGNEVLISRQLGKNPIDLKRPADTSPGNLIGLEVRDRLALVIDGASVGFVEAGDEMVLQARGVQQLEASSHRLPHLGVGKLGDAELYFAGYTISFLPFCHW
ncbi:MAG: hypothetical protein RX317_08475, partial [bacterium]|nr:hypothetical protein [bacterium]